MKVRSLKLPTKSFTLYPLSDVHWPSHDADKLDAWRDTVLSDDQGVVTLGGDLFDFARGHYRAHLGGYVADQNSRNPIDDMAYEKIEGLAAYLKPVKDRVLLTCVGNHFWRFQNGRVSDQELAIMLGIPQTFVGALGLQSISLKGRTEVLIALHHDAGRKGGTASTDLLAFNHWSHATRADIYCAGHTHRQYAGIFQAEITIPEGETKIGDRKLVFMRSGAFLRGYAESAVDPFAPWVPDYAEEKMLPPAVMGVLSCRVEASPTGKLYYELRQRTL
jgi:hypothetical protein